MGKFRKGDIVINNGIEHTCVSDSFPHVEYSTLNTDNNGKECDEYVNLKWFDKSIGRENQMITPVYKYKLKK